MFYLFMSKLSTEIIQNCSTWEMFFSPIYLFNHLFISVGTHIFYTLGDNLLLLYFVQNFLALAIWSAFNCLCFPLTYHHRCGVVWGTYVFSGMTVAPDPFNIFPSSVLKSAISPWSPDFFQWRMILETRIWPPGMLLSTRALLLLGPLSLSMRKFMYIQ